MELASGILYNSIMIICSICNFPKEEKDFYFRDKSKGIRRNDCITCHRARTETYYQKNKDKWVAYENNKTDEQKQRDAICNKKWWNVHGAEQNAHAKEVYQKRRLTVLDKYGSRCDCCGISDKLFLTVDHRNGDGAKDRKNYKGFLKRLYDLPVDFVNYRLLCWNCNTAYGIYGYCPHHTESTNFWPESFVGLSRNEKMRLWRHKVRKAVIDIYGGHCACCGVDKYEFLALDHVNGGGRQDRLVRSPFTMYTEVYKGGSPLDKYRILCHNCNNVCAPIGCCHCH